MIEHSKNLKIKRLLFFLEIRCFLNSDILLLRFVTFLRELCLSIIIRIGKVRLNMKIRNMSSIETN